MATKKVEFLVVDTTAFIQNAPLQEIATTMITCPEVVNEVTDKRQIRRLVALPYDLIVKEVFPENVKIVTDFSKKTGDYPSLSATDIKVIALTYQLEKEKVGVEHLRLEPVIQKAIITTKNSKPDTSLDVAGFYNPSSKKSGSSNAQDSTNVDDNADSLETSKSVTCKEENVENIKKGSNDSIDNDNTKQNETREQIANELNSEQLTENLQNLSFLNNEIECNEDILIPVKDETIIANNNESDNDEEDDDDDDAGWITPSNIQAAKKQINSELMEDKSVTVACMTTDFAMQNVLKQMNLNVTSLDGRLIKKLRTYILRCYSCFKTTSIMTKRFCPMCGNDTLKKVAVSLGKDGKMVIHINKKRPLTARGKKFSLPKLKGGKHPNNPILVEDQPMPDNRPSRLARTKNNPLDDDYIAGFSPFVMRDINSKSAQLCIRPNQEFKHWMRKNPNEARRKRK